MTSGARLAAAAMAVAVLAGCAGAPDVTRSDDPADYAHELFVGTNAARTEAGLDPLVWDECVAVAALARAQVVADTDTLEHQPLQAPCADNAAAGENLSYSEEDAATIVDRWMASPGHEANVVSTEFVDAGVGCVVDGALMACSWVAQGEAVSLEP